MAAGASYVARWTTYHVFPLMKAMQDAIQCKGFGFVEIVSQCPESYGRRIGMTRATDFLMHFKKQSVRVEKARDMSEDELKDRIVIGKLCDRDRPEYVSELHALVHETAGAVSAEVTA
jgi:2-oxoglutarate ferredoxin oxidoreductase subunit beta